jgi:hypothetical protein
VRNIDVVYFSMEDKAQVMAFGLMQEQWLFYISDSYAMLCLESSICILVLVDVINI